jgi:hypothetical protein
MKMPAIGTIVLIEFLDHDQSEDEVSNMTVYGRVAAVTSKEILVDTWHQTDDTDATRDAQKRNNALDSSAIVRRSITDWYALRY